MATAVKYLSSKSLIGLLTINKLSLQTPTYGGKDINTPTGLSILK